MLLLTLFGIGMLGIGLFAVVRPQQFAHGIVQFSEQAWFHYFEIGSRFILGVLFLALSQTTPYTTLFYVLGGILCGVAVFLILIGPSRHKRFARLTAEIGESFRVLGLVAIICGAALVYVGVA